MTKLEQIKALKLVLDNPANNINETSRDLIQLVITNIELDMQNEAKTNVVSFVENYIGEDKLEFSKRLAELGASGQTVIIVGGGPNKVGKSMYAQMIDRELNKENNVIIDTLGSGVFPKDGSIREALREKMIEATKIPNSYFGEEHIGAVNPASRRYKSKHNKR